jgi:hypothetical protein
MATKDFDMSKEDLAMCLHNGMFADRGTDLKAAFEYVDMIAKASENPAAVWTAVQVAVNTISNCIRETY